MNWQYTALRVLRAMVHWQGNMFRATLLAVVASAAWAQIPDSREILSLPGADRLESPIPFAAVGVRGAGAAKVRLRASLDGIFTVSEDELRRGVKHMASESHVVAEPAGAASLAAAWQQRGTLPEPIVCVVSGDNVAPNLLAELVAP